jgi:hypothetical protein
MTDGKKPSIIILEIIIVFRGGEGKDDYSDLSGTAFPGRMAYPASF